MTQRKDSKLRKGSDKPIFEAGAIQERKFRNSFVEKEKGTVVFGRRR